MGLVRGRREIDMNYIVSVEYRMDGEKKAKEEYRKFETLDEARENVARWVKIIKPACSTFDVHIYEITNY